MTWSTDDIPDLHGRTAVVTGANSGIGYQAAVQLAAHGARVLLACRDAERGADALRRARAEAPAGDLELVALDLADLAAVRAAADEIAGTSERLDLLINNAGVMALPRHETADGFEMQLGTNHLGHFALTGHLLPRLLAAAAPRVVTVSSEMHRLGRMRFDDLHGRGSYGKWRAYSQSKLANLLFARELQRRFGGAGLTSVAAHPGYASTNLQAVGPQMSGNRLMGAVMQAANAVFGQSELGGALPTLRAATDPDVVPGGYYGPSGPMAGRGAPTLQKPTRWARDDAAAGRLWEESERLTGVHFAALAV